MIEHTLLDPATLSPAAQKALGPGPAKMMAARGMAPLPPGDQLAVLYQITLDADASLAASAKATAAGLPDKLLAGALGDTKLDPRVLDLFGASVLEKPAAFDALVGNAAVADETIAALSGRAGAREVDMIAANEQRLLRHPEIIAAMYLNKHARMSTVDRAIELCVRNNVRVPGLPAWDEIAKSLQGGARAKPEDDAIFAAAAEEHAADEHVITTGNVEDMVDDNAPLVPEVLLEQKQEKKVPLSAMSISAKLRIAQMGNAFQRAELVRDPNKLIAGAAIKNPSVTDFEAMGYARNPGLCDEVIRYIASKREWTKTCGVKSSLCRNPKTPVTDAMRMLPFLREKDLANLIKSRGVPSAIVAQARKLTLQRRGGTDKK